MKKKPPRTLPPMTHTAGNAPGVTAPMGAMDIIRQYKSTLGSGRPANFAVPSQTVASHITQVPTSHRTSEPTNQDTQTMDYKAIIGKEGTRLEQQGTKQKEKEYQNYVKKLTLAQKRGLVKPPEPPLSVEQWQKVLEQAKHRAKSQQTCPICMDDFKLRTQVVLNCSHFFHQDCLASFEAHSSSKKCPVCRLE